MRELIHIRSQMSEYVYSNILDAIVTVTSHYYVLPSPRTAGKSGSIMINLCCCFHPAGTLPHSLLVFFNGTQPRLTYKSIPS